MSTKITAAEFASKFSCKNEIDKFLKNEAKAYLPDSNCVTEYHYRDLLTGKKKVSS